MRAESRGEHKGFWGAGNFCFLILGAGYKVVFGL